MKKGDFMPTPTDIHRSNPMCKHCGHALYEAFGKYEHYTRLYHPHSYPFSSKECYFGHKVDGFTRYEGCKCTDPEPMIDRLMNI